MEPRLFILMRTDLPSLNPGKAMAQAAHAANMLSEAWLLSGLRNPVHELYTAWRGDRGFGTTITLGAKKRHLDAITNFRKGGQPTGMLLNVVRDPTYPVVHDDGTVSHIDIVTCGWVFADKEHKVLPQFIGKLELHF